MMFAQHQPLIGALAQSSPTGLATIATFAIASPRLPLWRLPDIVSRASSGDFTNLFANKANGINLWRDNALARFETLNRLTGFPAIRLSYCARQRGLGWAKAGFLLQLAYGEAGCIDSVNLDLYGVPEKFLKRANRGKAKRQSTIDRTAKWYIRKCADLGGAEKLWDRWCREVYTRSIGQGREGQQSRGMYTSPDHVSAYHCFAVGLDAPYRDVLDDIPF